MQIQETALGKQHPAYAAMLSNTASCLCSQGNYGEAMKLYKQCREVFEASLGERHVGYATVLCNIA